MGLRVVVNRLDPPFAVTLESALHQALEDYPGDLDAVITPAMDEFHAEVVLTEDGARRAAYFAPLVLSVDEHVQGLRKAVRMLEASPRVTENRE